jgi:uracil-DNA glycosylase family 4
MKKQNLERTVKNCLCCSLRGARPVIGEGPMNAAVMLIGQNPGSEENKQGRPFVGRSGKYLNEVLLKVGLKREELFITGVVKCHTLHNRKPTTQEIKNCLPLLVNQIKQIQPKLIVLMGQVAWQTPRIKGIKYVETYHPAAAMRFPKIRKKFESDFERIKGML